MTPDTVPMDGATAYQRIVEAEVAMEMVNRARTEVQQRIYALERPDPTEADRLRQVAIKLYDQLRSIDPDRPAHNAAIIASFGEHPSPVCPSSANPDCGRVANDAIRNSVDGRG